MKTEELMRYERMRCTLAALTGADLMVVVNARKATHAAREQGCREGPRRTLPAANGTRRRP